MCHALFTYRQRTDMTPMLHGETEYGFLERSGRPSAGSVREILGQWISHFPEGEQIELAARMQRGGDRGFNSAFFEIYLHELVLHMGCAVTPHPENPSGQGTHPDFLVQDADGGPFYLEASVVTGMSEDEIGAEQRKAVVYDAIDRLDSPNFFLELDLEGAPNQQASGRKLRRRLERWLSQLSPDDVMTDIADRGMAALPKLDYGEREWRITFTAVPKRESARGRPEVRPIESLVDEGGWSTTRDSIKSRVEDKGSHYGDLRAPLVIGVDVIGDFVNAIDVNEALLGQEVFGIPTNGSPDGMRRPNGVWTQEGSGGSVEPRYQRISAVLVAPRLTPWTIACQSLRLYHNPWPNFPYSGKFCQLPQAKSTGTAFEEIDGVHPREILGLPEGWPDLQEDGGS